MQEKKEKPERKEYSNPYRSLEAIWGVLRKYSSRQHPLSVRDIHNYLKAMADAPSLSTVDRLLPGAAGLMGSLYPGTLAESGQANAVYTYLQNETLHVVVEMPDGQILRENAGIAYTAQPFRAPSYSTIDKMLKSGVLFDLKTYPYRLHCVTRDRSGKAEFISYDEWEDSLKGANNAPRYYYLENKLTDGEWRIFSDLVQVYPFISQRQTDKFLSVLNDLCPNPQTMLSPASRYAYKRGSEEQFRIINLLDQAIREKKKVKLTYGEYRLERVGGSWEPVLRQRKRNGELEVEPYALMWANGNYYLACKHQGEMNLRADRILSVRLLEQSFEMPPDFDPALRRDRSPVMYPGEATFVLMRCKVSMLNTLVDFFGTLPQYATPDNDTVVVSLSIAPNGVKLFALQYADSVEILEPAWLRQEILDTMEQAAKKYRS